MSYFGTKTRVNCNGICLKQDKITYTLGIIVNIHIVNECSSDTNDFDFALENCLFEAVKLTKNADIDKYKYRGYGIGLDARGSSSFPKGRFGQNLITFGVDMSSQRKRKKRKNVLFLGEGITQGLYDTKLNGINNYLFVNDTEIIKFKTNILKL